MQLVVSCELLYHERGERRRKRGFLDSPMSSCSNGFMRHANARTGSPPLPTTRAEMEARGWDTLDVLFVTGDAYVDHPRFAMPILGRALEAAGFRVAILSQPDWRSAAPWRQFGRPRLFFAVSAGNMDSMINHYTPNRKVRNDDAYSPGGRTGLRPGPGTPVYS